MNKNLGKYDNGDKENFVTSQENIDSPSTELVITIVVLVVLVTLLLLFSCCLRAKLVRQTKWNEMDTIGNDLPPNYAELELPSVALDFTTCQPPSYEDISNKKQATHLAKKINSTSNDGIEIVSETCITE